MGSENTTTKQLTSFVSNDKLAVGRALLSKKYGERFEQYRLNWERCNRLEYVTKMPIHIDLDTADLCNFHCNYCTEEHNYIRKRTKAVLQSSFIESLFAEIANFGEDENVCSVNIGNLGEPFLHPDKVFEILRHANQSGIMETFLHTNGSLMNFDHFIKLVECDLKFLLFSIDAASKETYKVVRGGDFDKLFNLTKSIHDYKERNGLVFPITRASFVISELNSHEKELFVEFWSKYVDYIDLQPMIDLRIEVPKNIEPSISCPNPFVRMGIAPDGSMAPCCLGYMMLPGFKVGTFPEISIYEAWNSEQTTNMRKAMLDKDFTKHIICKNCLLRMDKDV